MPLVSLFRRGALLIFVLMAGWAGGVQAQETGSRLRVFFDCESFRCDFDHLRREVGFVNYVRDRQDADVHVLVTTQRTGAGGQEFTLAFIGLRAFEGVEDELRYVSEPTASDDEIRTGIAQTLKAGLVRYLSRTPALGRLRISYDAPEGQATAETQDETDPWNFWVFRTSARGFLNAESQQNRYRLSGSVRASRTTETWRIDLRADGNFNESNFEIDDSTTVTNISESYNTNHLVVRSLGPHWSVGGRASAAHSTFRNYDLVLVLAPAIEYNIFPYDESTRRQFVFLYQLAVVHFNYIEPTIFGETAETRLNTSLSGGLEVRQPWGTAQLDLEGSVYLHDLAKLRLDVFGELEIRIVRGLELDLFGGAALIRDQLFLPIGDASEEDILLQRRALSTGFEVFGSVGLSYTFGSRFTNVVNPRFDGDGRRF